MKVRRAAWDPAGHATPCRAARSRCSRCSTVPNAEQPVENRASICTAPGAALQQPCSREPPLSQTQPTARGQQGSLRLYVMLRTDNVGGGEVEDTGMTSDALANRPAAFPKHKAVLHE